MDPNADQTHTGTGVSEAPDRRPLRVGELVAGRFRIVREIAEGGMGIVYEAIDEKLNERRALKCAKPGFANRLSPEARTSLRVTHQNVCRVFEIHSAGTPFGPVDFLTMEYVDGGTLSNELRRRRQLPEPEARELARQICAGVAAAHAEGLLHRDLKSNNVMLTEDSHGRRRAVVTDFGLAQETRATDQAPAWSGLAGTPAYLAPERLRGAHATIASDIFALGVVLHEVGAGRLPSVADGGSRTLSPSLPRRWRPIVARCLHTDPAHRYQSVEEVAGALGFRASWGRRSSWAAAAIAVLALGAWPAMFPATLGARLAILPIEAGDADPKTAALVHGATSELSSRLMRLRPRPAQLVVIPVGETRGLSDLEIARAKDRLGATHVLRGTVTSRGDQILVRGLVVDTSTQVPLAERSSTFGATDPGAVASALASLVASTFRLPRQTDPDRIAPAAYADYAEGLTANDSPASHPQAIAAFERAIALDSQSVLPRAGLVDALYNAWSETSDPRWLARAGDELGRAEALNSDSLTVRLAAGHVNLVPGRYDRAVQEYQRATQLAPTSAPAWAGLARAYMELHDRDSDAAAAYIKAIQLQPGYYAPLIDAGDFYRRRGNYAEAEKHWHQVVEVAPGFRAGHANLGGLYTDMGRYDDAERELRRALEISPDYRVALNNLGSLYQYMRRDGEAVTQFERARTVDRETPTLMLNLGDSYRRLGRQEQAVAAYRRGLALAEPILLSNPRDPANRTFVAYFALRLGDRATAERELLQALNSGGENRAVVRRAAICYEALGDRARALAVLDTASPDLLRELGRQPDLVSLRGDPRFIALLSNVPAT